MNFNEEEVNIVIGIIIQPFDCRPMFLFSFPDNPNYNFRIQSGRICDDLAKMIMICAIKLIFNNNDDAWSFIFCN